MNIATKKVEIINTSRLDRLFQIYEDLFQIRFQRISLGNLLFFLYKRLAQAKAISSV